MIKRVYVKSVNHLIKNPFLNKVKAAQFLWNHFSFLKDFYYECRDLPDFLAIENIGECNRRCPYCPHYWSPRNRNQMPEPIFKKIVDDLGDSDYRGRIFLAPWGEALLDTRLPSLVRYARKKIPGCFIEVQTNGDLLTYEKFRELVSAGVNEFHVSEHYKIMDGRYVIDEPKQDVRKFLELDKENRKLFHFDDRNSKRVMRMDRFHNRSGLVPLKDEISIKDLCRICDLPEAILSINYKGDVVLCARQWKDDPTYGNVMDERLTTIWNHVEYRRIRKELRKGIFNLDLCKSCNFGYLPDAFK